jgi:hypothetical protein
MSGWKTVVASVAVTLLGILESTQVTSLVAAHPGAVTTVVGVLMLVLRFVTTSPIFKSE